MLRTHALLVSLAVGLAAVAGVFALGRTLSLGQQAHVASDHRIAQRSAQLDRYEASLRKALAQKPPPLPPVPRAAGTSAGSGGAPLRVVYHRPPPIVVTTHRLGDQEHEAEGGEADD